jgi:hypothetical protein
MTQISAPVSAGELLDKITILRIKSRRMVDPDAIANVRTELAALEKVWARATATSLKEEEADLTRVNEALWEIEDNIRDHERRQDFGPGFIHLARQVYLTNDRRAAIKRAVNQMLGSALKEEKSYRPYRS